MFISREINIQKRHYSELFETKKSSKKYFYQKIKLSENSKLDFWNRLKPPKPILKGQIKIMIFSSKKCKVKVINILKNQKISQPYKSFDKIWKYIRM